MRLQTGYVSYISDNDARIHANSLRKLLLCPDGQAILSPCQKNVPMNWFFAKAWLNPEKWPSV